MERHRTINEIPMEKTSSPIAQRLKTHMQRTGMNVAQLAKRASVKPWFIYDILHGKSANPSVVTLAQVADALNINISELLGSSPSATSESSPAPSVEAPLHNMSGFMETGGDYVVISSALVEATLSGDTIILQEETGKPYYFRRNWIRDRLHTSPADLRMLPIRGDGMNPTLCADDIILVDVSKRTPSPPGLFAIFDGAGLVIRRLEMLGNTSPPAVRVIADNPRYSTYEIAVSDLHIIGRIVWFARQLF